MPNYSNISKSLVFIAAMSLINTCIAEWKLPESAQIHGFLSQGYILTTHNNFFGHSTDDGSLDFRELGINGSWRPLSNLQLSLQVLSRNAGRTDDGDPRIDFGFLDYSYIYNAENSLGVRLGRVVNPLGLYNDTRDMAFTRPSILLPQSVYFDVNRNLALSADGAQVYGEWRSHFGDFFLQFNTGLPRVTDPDLPRLIGELPGELTPELSWVGRLSYEKDGGRLKHALTAAQVNTGYDPAGKTDPFQAGSLDFDPLIFSVQYNAEHWSLTGEYAIRPIRFKGFGPLVPDTHVTGESYYVQATYQFAPKWEGLLRYDVLYRNRDDRDGNRFAALTGLPAHSLFAKDLTVGLRWDVTPSFMVRAEFHHINGTGWLSALENADQMDTDQHWDLFALLASYRF